ncbi:16852_t:CDS:2 [Dentiscutata erythropus]|uniref:16852_t:CDS:1 n=1 Tax=Dentiscutata erythropus TaxID=1348616 RepID=A0A9N9FC97_9GLOM|nr:16852_t:CDS:2 [Dentiscutata erythropus]
MWLWQLYNSTSRAFTQIACYTVKDLVLLFNLELWVGSINTGCEFIYNWIGPITDF